MCLSRPNGRLIRASSAIDNMMLAELGSRLYSMLLG